MDLTVIQISDTHLFADVAQTLHDENSETNFISVLNKILVDEQADVILLTGDLADAGSPLVYQRLIEHCQLLSCPIYAIPGNHDDVLVQQKIFADSCIRMDKSILWRGWHIILLDSVVMGHCEGRLSDNELQFLTDALTSHPRLPTVVALHHHVLPVGGTMDTIKLTNADTVLQIISKHKQVKVVLSGHVHQANDQTIGATRFLTAPSTCYQIKPDCTEFELENNLMPGYRWLKLTNDGKVKTQVRRIKRDDDGKKL